MKLGALPLINQIVCTRDALLGKLNAVNNSQFVVTIGGGEREDAEVLRVVKPVLRQQLVARIEALERELAEYDVDVLG